MAGGLIFLLVALLAAVVRADEYCAQAEALGYTDCHSCVEITFLGGRHDCAYCANPYPGFPHCQTPFYPPAASIPGFTVYACWNNTVRLDNPPPGYYKPRCSANDCYIDQCTISGAVLWYIIVPSVVGGVLLIGGGYLLWCCHKRRQRAMNAWIAKEERAEQKAADKRAEKSRARNAERKNKTDELRRKYGLLEDDEEDL